jgi:hypothetical protein
MIPTVRWTARNRLENCGALLLVFLATTASAFDQDDAALFNYMNNVAAPAPIFYYADYVPLVPQVAAYLLRGLPFVVQAIAYRLLPAVLMLVLYREMQRLWRFHSSPVDAALLALSAMLILRAVDPYVWSNLAFVLWPAFMAALVHVLRLTASNARYSWWVLAGIVVTMSAIPIGGLLAVGMLATVRRGGDSVRNRQSFLAGVAGLLGYGFLNARLLSGSVGFDPIAALRLFREGFTNEHRLANVVAGLSVLVLIAATFRSLRKRSDAADTTMTLLAAWVGVLSIGGYLLSDRLASNDGGIGSYHVLPALLAALIVAGQAVLRVRDQLQRALLIGLFAGVASAGIAYDLYHHLRGPLEIAVMKYHFLSAAQSFRQTCRDGEGLIFEDEDTSPIVLCRPRHFDIGLHRPTELTPHYGANNPDTPTGDHPFIYVGEPLFQ